MVRVATLWEKLDGGRVRCGVCRRLCVIEPGRRGFCLTRENRSGELFTVIYGAVSSLHVSPIEVKPLYHFYPGTTWLSLGSLGCNFRCPGCQNWEIAHSRVDDAGRAVRTLEAPEVVNLALDRGCKGLSWTYNEPTVWLEYTIDASRLGKEKGLLANYVTNGYITPEALDEVAPALDAYRVDIKAFDRDTCRQLANTADFEGVLDSAVRAKEAHGLHVECVTNVVPGFNDGEAQLRALADWIVEALGADTPWHVTRFVPHLDLSHVPPTPVAALEWARAIGLERGLRYVYIGNVPGHPAENTHCHACGALLIERRSHGLVVSRVVEGRCPACAADIPGRWD